MLSYLTVTNNGLFLLKSFEKRDVQKFLFQDYFKANQINGTDDYAKFFHGKFRGSLKIMSP